MPHPSAFLIDVLRLMVWLVILVAIFVPLERLFAVRPRPVLREDWLVDLAFYFLNSLLPALLLALPMAMVAAFSRRLLPEWWTPSLAALPLWLRMTLVFAIGEIGFYWGHRWSHEWPWMWRFHRVHHTPDGLDWLVNTRAHPFDMIFTRLCGLLPLYAISLASPGADGSTPALLVILVGTIWGFFIHANVRWRLGPLEQIIATPRFHHWHHVRSGPINRNYAAMVPLMDRLFATFYLPSREWPAAYGIDGEAGAVASRVAPLSPASSQRGS